MFILNIDFLITLSFVWNFCCITFICLPNYLKVVSNKFKILVSFFLPLKEGKLLQYAFHAVRSFSSSPERNETAKETTRRVGFLKKPVFICVDDQQKLLCQESQKKKVLHQPSCLLLKFLSSIRKNKNLRTPSKGLIVE